MRVSKHISLMLALVLAAFLAAPGVLAAELRDPDRPVSLTMTFEPEGEPAAGTAFRVWRVAEVDRNGQIIPLKPYADWPVQIEGLDPQAWPDLASTLEGYVTEEGTPPTDTAVTDQLGRAIFSGLEAGFYLVTGEPWEQDGACYVPQAVMICLPVLYQGEWIYDLSANTKYDEIPEGSEDSVTEIRVVKIWSDNNDRHRPEEITVRLLKDREIYDTVTLAQDNDWRHTWTGLEGDARWQVTEPAVPDGYTVTITREGNTFLVTNTGGEHPPGGESPPGGKLPQTGVVWWPVPVLAVSGMGCYLVGWVKDRKEQEDDA